MIRRRTVRHIQVVRAKRAQIAEYKKSAQAFAREQCEDYAKLYGVHYNKITIRAQKRRWGSCSRAGNLSFNYKIALLPRRLAAYVIAHEICHLLSFDHSPRFWQHVERAIPEHRALRAALRSIAFRFE